MSVVFRNGIFCQISLDLREFQRSGLCCVVSHVCVSDVLFLIQGSKNVGKRGLEGLKT